MALKFKKLPTHPGPKFLMKTNTCTNVQLCSNATVLFDCKANGWLFKGWSLMEVAQKIRCFLWHPHKMWNWYEGALKIVFQMLTCQNDQSIFFVMKTRCTFLPFVIIRNTLNPAFHFYLMYLLHWTIVISCAKSKGSGS